MNSTLSIDSNPQSAANTATSSTSHQRKRAACDRCRGQKLRCNIEDQNGKCIRCTAAGTTCNFSPSMRTGRPPIPSSNTSPPDRRGKQKPGQGVPRTKLSNAGRNGLGGCCKQNNYHHGSGRGARPHSHRMSLDDRDEDMDTGHETSSADELAIGAFNPPSMHDPLPIPDYPECAVADIARDDAAAPTVFDGEDLFIPEKFGSDFNWSIFQPPTIPKDTQIAATSSPSGRDRWALHADWGQNERLPNELQMSEPPRSADDPTASVDPASRDFDSHVGTAGGISHLDEEPTASSMGDLDESGCGWLSSEDTRSMPSGHEAQHQRMQQISELTMSLYSLITTDDQRERPHSATNTTSSSLANSLQDQFVGSVLKYSTAFLKILKSFHPSTSSSLSTRPLTQFSVLGSSDSDVSASDSASIFSDFARTSSAHKMRSPPDGGLRRPRSIASRSDFSNDNDSPSTPVPADVPTVFQLLICYIRIIHLHSILYARILDHLLASLPSSGNHGSNRNNLTASQRQEQQQKQEVQQPPPVFPGLHVGGVSLDDFSVFQVKLISQISTHLLGEIEMALGLPNGFRISRRTPGTTGVLETSVSVQFIETTMREIETTMPTIRGRGPEMGVGVEQDRVNSIKESLVSLSHLLKGTINI